ncbi:DUF3784 domain-containing protein [Pseudogracilibacillus sp. SO30301A]|uniref:DUF3784 domain-containing protein n=1 Tax=Pseudogracilibacillus sp. SO30301A TaxID=3098291 RepID=UPI00300E5786
MVLFVLFGINFSFGKGSSLITGFNIMPVEEKEKYDAVALSKFMGKVMFGLSLSMVLWVFSGAYDIEWLFFVGLILFLGIIVFTLIYVNTGNRFKKGND